MALKVCIIALLIVAVSAQGKQETRYGGGGSRPGRPGAHGGGGFGGGNQGGFAGRFPGGGGNQGAFQGGFPGGFPAGAGPQGGFPGGVGHQGGFPGGVGQQGGFPGGVGHQGGFQGGIGGGGFGPGGIGNTGVTGIGIGGGNLEYNCAATASQGQFGIDKTCQKWCKAPQQYWGGKYVCCDDRPAICPPVRAECPKFGGGLGPVCCFVDSQCQIPTDKCCYDTCLGHKVCKNAYKQGF